MGLDPCLSVNVVDHSFKPTTDHRLGALYHTNYLIRHRLISRRFRFEGLIQYPEFIFLDLEADSYILLTRTPAKTR